MEPDGHSNRTILRRELCKAGTAAAAPEGRGGGTGTGPDLIVQAKSGTGKTCVFSTIALDAVLLESPVTQILVLAPTREIAVQIHAVITTIGVELEGLECHVFIGGTPLSQDRARLRRCHIAVGSPGRIKQLIELDYLNTASIRLFILDEADKLLEEGSFQEQINWIYSSLPANKQMLAVSATYPESLAGALTRYMREPTFVRLNPTDPGLLGLKQYYKIVNSHPLPHKTFEEKTQHLQELFSKVPFNQALVFSNLHSRAQHLAEILTSRGFPAECISGSMNQNQRLDAMAKLKQFHCRVLISTDLTSRGIDADKVNLVVNLDVPADWETYMHRVGRAGRFGTLGLSVTYCCRGEEENTMRNIAQRCNLQLLPLPDPIPRGMMVQFEDGEVEVKPVVPTDTSVHSDPVCVRPEEPALQPAQRNLSEAPEPLPSPPADDFSVERPKKPLKVKQVKKCTNSANTEKGRNPQMSHCPPGQRSQVKTVSRTSGQCDTQSPEEEALRKNLPRIPCLSSFKNHQNNPWSFSELVEDYEYFITEGLEREVEVVRSCSGPGEQGRSEAVGWEEEGHDTGRVANGVMSGDSDGSYSSRASSKSRENNSCLEAFSDTEEKDAVPPEGQGHAGFCPAPEQPQELPPIPKQNQVKKKVLKQNSKQKKRHNQQFPDAATGHPAAGCSCSSGDAAASCEAWSYKNYWQWYYQAWQDYCTAVSHYRSSYRQLSWLNTYHANSVYLQELLKGGD
ncbi:PREDICTED: probable ATP-dependent RNA helicase DDX20 [Chaetura pelagica]|uniref:probable ATP-dependent RNA helicase DDX20 n=1 Tax=Chaetura pelagica TaxID=8897 RepID=UPI00052312A0|nr:PREDICTED: probable ATP-dependent RNA helicase DDX20 [Chaetura pelagica]